MRLGNTLWLASAFILLGAYLYFYELPRGGKAEKLLSFKVEEIEGVTLAYPQEEIRLQKEASGRWRLTRPVESPADDLAVAGILSSLSGGEVQRKVEDRPSAEELKTFGLDRPVKVLLTLKSGASLPDIQVGEKTPLGNSAYVRRGGQAAVFLTGASVRSALDKKLSDFRDRRIAEFDEASVRQLALSGEKGDFLLGKKGEQWFLEKPESVRADQAEVKSLLAALRNLAARDFVEDAPSDLKRYGLDRPRLQIALSLGAKEEKREILFGGKREGKEESYLALGSRQTVYSVSESAFRGADKDLGALRDKEILQFARDQVTRVEIQTAKESLALVKKEKEEWHAEAPRQVKTKAGTVENYLSGLAALQAKGFAKEDRKGAKKYGFSSPSLKVSLEAKDGKKLGTLVVGEKVGGNYFAQREGSSAVYILDGPSYDQAKKQLVDFLP